MPSKNERTREDRIMKRPDINDFEWVIVAMVVLGLCVVLLNIYTGGG